MCGLAGFIPLKGNINSVDMHSIGSKMANAILSRGPDDSGVWVEQNLRIAMSFRRLAILDLTPAGHQPMQSNSGRYYICFNGEIYNHLDLRKDLSPDIKWKGYSDTETILAVIENIGIEEALSKFVGMFAFALWDQKKERLTLARDRMGEKPMYYGFNEGAFIFGSELKALKQHPDFSNEISRLALSNFLKYNYVPAPQSIYKNIYKLSPGSFIHIDSSSLNKKQLEPQRYWSFSCIAHQNQKNLIKDPGEAFSSVKYQLSESVKSQLISDVPLGAFLSGGVDSSLIVAMMQEQSSSPVKTFTIGFEDSNFDESPYAKEVAKHLGTNHEEYFVTASETLDVIPKLPNIYDEPFADSSQIPTYLVCKEAKKMVTVALSGDGGDELFGGYNRYFWSARVWQQVKWMPLKIRKFLGFSISMTPDIFWDSAGAVYNFLTPNDKGISMISDKAKKMGLRMQSIASEDDLYLSLVSQWEDTDNLLQDFDKQENEINLLADNNIEDAPSRMMFWDSLTYLPDDILCKVDRASMAVSLETRAPFLDHRLIELAWQLDPSLKIDDKIGKKILRSILDEYVPRNLIDRPKAGFGIPVGSWLRGPLKSWAEELIDENRIKTEGYFNYEPIRLIWRQHLSGRFDHTHKLWSILMFQSWLETQ